MSYYVALTMRIIEFNEMHRIIFNHKKKKNIYYFTKSIHNLAAVEDSRREVQEN